MVIIIYLLGEMSAILVCSSLTRPQDAILSERMFRYIAVLPTSAFAGRVRIAFAMLLLHVTYIE